MVGSRIFLVLIDELLVVAILNALRGYGLGLILGKLLCRVAGEGEESVVEDAAFIVSASSVPPMLQKRQQHM